MAIHFKRSLVREVLELNLLNIRTIVEGLLVRC